MLCSCTFFAAVEGRKTVSLNLTEMALNWCYPHCIIQRCLNCFSFYIFVAAKYVCYIPTRTRIITLFSNVVQLSLHRQWAWDSCNLTMKRLLFFRDVFFLTKIREGGEARGSEPLPWIRHWSIYCERNSYFGAPGIRLSFLLLFWYSGFGVSRLFLDLRQIFETGSDLSANLNLRILTIFFFSYLTYA